MGTDNLPSRGHYRNCLKCLLLLLLLLLGKAGLGLDVASFLSIQADCLELGNSIVCDCAIRSWLSDNLEATLGLLQNLKNTQLRTLLSSKHMQLKIHSMHCLDMVKCIRHFKIPPTVQELHVTCSTHCFTLDMGNMCAK